MPAKPQLPPEVYTSPAPRPRPAPPPKPSNPIYQEPDEPIAFYAMGRGSPGEAPSNVYAEVEVPPGAGGQPCGLGHPALRRCRSRPVAGGQVKRRGEQAGRWEEVLKARLGCSAQVFRVDARVRVRVRGLRPHGKDGGSVRQQPFPGPRSGSLSSPCSHGRPPVGQPPPLLRGNSGPGLGLAPPPQGSLHFCPCPSHPVPATRIPSCATILAPTIILSSWLELGPLPLWLPPLRLHRPTILRKKSPWGPSCHLR